MGRNLVTLAVLIVTSCAPAPAPTDTGTQSPVDTGTSAPTACVSAGGVCVLGQHSTTTPGFTITCPPGRVLDNGQPSTLGGGFDLIQSGIGQGCEYAPGGGTYPAGCCFVSDAGADDVVDVTADDATDIATDIATEDVTDVTTDDVTDVATD